MDYDPAALPRNVGIVMVEISGGYRRTLGGKRRERKPNKAISYACIKTCTPVKKEAVGHTKLDVGVLIEAFFYP